MTVEIIEDATDPGFFELGEAFAPDADDLGFFTYSPFIVSDPADPGFFAELFAVATPYVPTPTLEEALAGNREVDYTYELVSASGASRGALSGVTGGSLEWTASATVKGSGSLSWVNTGTVDWLNVRVKITANVSGYTWGLGVWLPSVPTLTHHATVATGTIEILSREAVLSRDFLPSAYSLPSGTLVTDAVRTLIADSGEAVGALTESDVVTSAPMVWPAGTSRLRIINDLADVAGFFSLWTDGEGQFRFEPYVRPGARAISREFVDGATAIYTPGFSRTQDIYAIPNRVIALTAGTGTDAALVSVAENDDPESPYSYTSRGQWISVVEENVEAATQTILDAYAARRLAELTAVSAAVELQHAPVPLEVSNVVRFASSRAAVDARHVVTKTTINLTATALATSSLREVADA